jgi:hypothetical protein
VEEFLSGSKDAFILVEEVYSYMNEREAYLSGKRSYLSEKEHLLE